jgi:lysophospholipase L1-like esterase
VLRAGLMAACGSWVARAFIGESIASASNRLPASTRVSVIGDSLTTGTVPYQANAFADVGFERTTLDAFQSRGVRTKVKRDPHTGLTAVDAIRDAAGDSEVWVVELGTNDSGIHRKEQYPELILQMMDRIGGGHYVMWVNIYLPAKPQRQQNWNAALAAVAVDFPDEMFVLNWATVADQNPRWTSNDRIHCTPVGYKNRATTIANACRVLIPSTPSVLRPVRTRRPGLTISEP